jgi:preprotein translocase subunit YajC
LIECWLVNPIILAADPGLGAALGQFLLLFGPLFLICYFLVIMPQQRQKRKTQEMLANLKTGDRVLTNGGIYGSVVGFHGEVVQLQIASQVKVEVARSAVAGVVSAESQETEPKEQAAKPKK